MDFDLDEQQRDLRDAARRFLERETPIGYARAMMDDARGYRDDVWKQMADLGWMALPFAEDHGGLNIGFTGLALLLIEMGRVVLPGPYLPTMLAGFAIDRFGTDEQRAKWMPGIISGQTVAAFAAEGGALELRNGMLHGTRAFVHGGEHADLVVAVAHVDGDAGLFISEPTTRKAVSMLDATQRFADLSFVGARAERIGEAGLNELYGLSDIGSVLMSAEMLGCAERATELSVEYAKAREQFGRPIGSFQAVKHRAADMHVDVESLRNAVYYAAWTVERAHPDATLASSITKAFASDGAVRVCKSAIQIHGGIGFTWEADLHLYLKRVLGSAEAFGNATFHRERVAKLVAARG